MLEVLRTLAPSGQGGGAGWLLAGALTVAVACGGNTRPPAEPPPQTPVSETAPGEAAPPPPPGPAAPRELVPEVIIEPADPESDASPTLAEAALRERERRRRSGEPMVVITDANLDDYAVGQLTFMEDEETPESEAAPGAAEGDGADEQYWRDRVRGIRQRWAEAAAEVPVLEERATGLRRRFYETDDAYYRDTRIKPAWDRAIDLIAQARAEVDAHRAELEAALEEGRQAGALPGWLREGIELEPPPSAPEPDPREPGEPRIVEPGEVREP